MSGDGPVRKDTDSLVGRHTIWNVGKETQPKEQVNLGIKHGFVYLIPLELTFLDGGAVVALATNDNGGLTSR